MNGLVLAKKESIAILDDLVRNRSRIGEFDWELVVPDVADALRRLGREDALIAEEMWYDLARRLTRDYVRHNAPPIPEDASQLALFYDPDALLSLGEREVIRMAEARASHLERYRTVLTMNFHAQSNAFFGRSAYIDDRLPHLRERGCTLGDLEDEFGEETAA